MISQHQRIGVLIVDDHPMVRTGLAATIEPEQDMKVVGLAATGEQAVDLFQRHRPDVTLMDLGLRGRMSGIDAIQHIRRNCPQAKIIVLSALTGEEHIYQALSSGAVTFLFKDALGDELIKTIREVYQGGRPLTPEVARKLADRVTHATLTPRELEVLKLVANGLTNKEIAQALGISLETAQGHVKNILAKLQVDDRTRAVTLAVERGIIHLS
jgi:two-component system, NarL family, response regulator